MLLCRPLGHHSNCLVVAVVVLSLVVVVHAVMLLSIVVVHAVVDVVVSCLEKAAKEKESGPQLSLPLLDLLHLVCPALNWVNCLNVETQFV